MDSLLLNQYLLAGLFFCITLVYSTVGLGGGSAYTALLTIAGVSYTDIPTISLFLNILVTSITSISFFKGGHGRTGLILPVLLTSVPGAFLGGMLDISARLFEWILLMSLILVAARIYIFPGNGSGTKPGPIQTLVLSLSIGLIFGLLSGIVGIGGGIYLIPLIRIFNLGTIKEASAAGAVFTLANSLSGFTSRVHFHGLSILSIIPLVVAVIAGGFLGAYAGAFRFSAAKIQKILGIIILLAAIVLMVRILNGTSFII